MTAGGAAAVLLWAGLEKLRDVRTVAASMAKLGLAGRAAPAAAWMIVLAELTVALLLVTVPETPIAPLGLVLLGGSFAASGMVALLRDQRVRCYCFGRTRRSTLGWRQIVAFPIWLTAGYLIWQFAGSPASIREAGASLAMIAILIASLRSADLLSEFRRARGDRRSAERMYPWSQS